MIAALILSRMGSSRLPNKAMMQLGARSLVEWPMDALMDFEGITPILTTSIKSEDNALEDLALKKEMDIFRGSEDDVALRIIECCRAHNITHFFRVNGDSPFVNIPLMKEAIEILHQKDVDLVSNLITRTHPYGIACELIKVDAFEKTYTALSESEKEHITSFMYKNLEQFKYEKLDTLPHDYSRLELTVDTSDDLLRLNMFLKENKLKNLNKSPILEVISEYLRFTKIES